MLPDVLLFLLPGCKKEKIVKISRFLTLFAVLFHLYIIEG